MDYTVNAGLGVPMMTGPEDAGAPVNNQLPAWDAAAGLTLSTAVLAALRARDATGKAQDIRVALGDVGAAFMSAVGAMAEAELTGPTGPGSATGSTGPMATRCPPPMAGGRWWSA